MKCKCGNPMFREIRPERWVCKICGRSDWDFPTLDMRKHGKKRGAT